MLCAIHDTQVLQVKGPFDIDGVLSSEGLTVSLKSLDSGGIISKQTFPRFDDQELRIIDDIPSNGSGFCDLLAGETNEGLGLVIESHRFYEADPQGNARAHKVCVTIYHLKFR